MQSKLSLKLQKESRVDYNDTIKEGLNDPSFFLLVSAGEKKTKFY